VFPEPPTYGSGNTARNQRGDLDTKTTAFVVSTPTVLPPLFDATERDPEMEEFLREYYDLAGRVEFADIYSRKER